MSLVKPLFVASIASLTLMMTSMSSTINLLQQMGILPTLGTCSNCSSPTGAYKSEGLYNYFRCSNCKKKQSLLQNTFLSNSNTTLHDYVLLMYQSSHLQYCCKGNFPASTTEKVKVYTRGQWISKISKIKTGHLYSYVKLNFKAGLF